MRTNKYTLAALVATLIVIFALSAWGHLLELDPDTLSSVRTGASVLGAAVLAQLGRLISRDQNRDGIPDALQAPQAPEGDK